MQIVMFIINELFGQGAIFLAMIAMIGLILQKKSFSEVVRGTFMTAIGYMVLKVGTDLIQNNSIDGLVSAFGAMFKQATPTSIIDVEKEYGTFIGVSMLLGFIINILVAKFTKWKTVFLTGHMLISFPFFFVAAGADAGLTGIPLLILGILFSTAYYIISPNLMRPIVKKVTGSDAFTIGHPTTCFSVLGAFIGSKFGDKSHSTEEIKFPKGLSFLKEIPITGSLVIGLTYIVIFFIMKARGVNPAEIWGYNDQLFTYIFTHAMFFGVGLIVMLQGIRLEIAEILAAFKGFSDKLVPNAIPALDCPTIFNYGPNALLIGFLTSMVTSIITIILTNGMFPTIVIPITATCFFEIGCASIVGNAYGGVRGCVLTAAISGVIMVFLVGFGAYFFNNTVQSMLLTFGGQDFSLWGIIVGAVSKLLVALGL